MSPAAESPSLCPAGDRRTLDERAGTSTIGRPELDDEEIERLHAEARRETGHWGRAGAGCLIVARSTGRALVPFRSTDVVDGDCWGTWGGAIDPDEDPASAVLREIREETGWNGPVVLHEAYVFEDAATGFRYSNFVAAVEDEFDPELNWENDDAQWFEPGVWPSNLHFGLDALLSDPGTARVIEEAVQGVGRAAP